ncbi:hypothetical protein HMPREF1985_01181 [Mitsuokella sp. oral taxon 131 str. W9106]|nr:hypothetical protein HMPREF1985_01181 [Mitsuokella sp. oral taxon 131 str. W9106]
MNYCSYSERAIIMKKTYKVEVGCANCAAKMERVAARVEGVKAAHINFMLLKMKVEFEEGASPADVMPHVLAACRKIESDCEIFF